MKMDDAVTSSIINQPMQITVSKIKKNKHQRNMFFFRLIFELYYH